MLAPCYLIHGGEPFQTEEYIAVIKHIAAKAGYNNSMVFEINAQFDWEELLNKCQTMDLFAERSMVELRLHSENLGKAGAESLAKLLSEQHSDVCILIRAPKLKAQTVNSSWVKTIQKNGKVQCFKPIPFAQMPAWVRQRLESAGFQPADAVVTCIAACYEGSLTAAAQCIEKIKTTCPAGALTLEQVKPLLEDNSRFSIFELADAAISGAATRTYSIFQSLKNEGVEPVLLLWGVTREIRNLLHIQNDIDRGLGLAQSAQQLGIWRDKIPAIKNALERLSSTQLAQLLKICKTIDTTLKGISPGHAWEPLLSVYLTLASSKTLTCMEDLNI